MSKKPKPWLVIETSYDRAKGVTNEVIISRHTSSNKANLARSGLRQSVRYAKPGE